MYKVTQHHGNKPWMMHQLLKHKFNNLMNLPTAKPCTHDSMTKNSDFFAEKQNLTTKLTKITNNNHPSANGVMNIWKWTLKSHWFMHYGIVQESQTFKPTQSKHSKLPIQLNFHWVHNKSFFMTVLLWQKH